MPWRSCSRRLLSLCVLSSLATGACPGPEELADAGGAAHDAATADGRGDDRAAGDGQATDLASVDAVAGDGLLADLAVVDSAGRDQAGRDATGGDLARDGATTSDAATPDAATTDNAASDVAAADHSACQPLSLDSCDGVTPSGRSYSLKLAAHGLGGAATVDIGATRAQVSAALAGAVEQPASFNAFAVLLCSEGLLLHFADNLGGGAANEGQLSDDDRLYKITAFGDFTGATDSARPLSIGDSAVAATASLGAADEVGTGISVGNAQGEQRFWYQGYSVLLVDGAVSAISIFGSQSPTGTLRAALDLAAGKVGAVTASHTTVADVPLASGSTLTQVRAAFGASPEADGDTSVDLGGTQADLVMLSYSSLGVLFAGPTQQVTASWPPQQLQGDDRKVLTAVLSPPFQGTTAGGVGLWSSRAQVEAELGAPYAVDTNASGQALSKYRAGGRNVGVVYADDQRCVERAVLIFVNLFDA